MERLYTLEEVAEATGLSARALADGARAQPPKFDHVRLHGKRWMTADQVRRLLEQHTVSATVSPVPETSEFDRVHARLLRRAARQQHRG